MAKGERGDVNFARLYQIRVGLPEAEGGGHAFIGVTPRHRVYCLEKAGNIRFGDEEVLSSDDVAFKMRADDGVGNVKLWYIRVTGELLNSVEPVDQSLFPVAYFMPVGDGAKIGILDAFKSAGGKPVKI